MTVAFFIAFAWGFAMAGCYVVVDWRNERLENDKRGLEAENRQLRRWYARTVGHPAGRGGSL